MKSLRDIPLSSFLTKSPYSVRFGLSPEIEKSIKEGGLYQPVTAVRKEKRYLIVSGRRRFLAARKLGFKSLPCVITAEKDPRKLFIMNVRNDSETSSPYTPVEKAIAFKTARGLRFDMSGMRELFQMLKIPFSNESKLTLESILKCPSPVREWLHEKDFPFTLLGFMTELSPADLKYAAERIFRPLGTGVNETSFIAAALRDISIARKVSVPAASGELLKDIGDSMTRKEALELLRKRIMAARYPLHSKLMEALTRIKTELELPRFCQLEYGHPSAAESLLFQARISGLRDAEKLLAWLNDSRNRKILFSFIKLMDSVP
jgi:hypothetical protein